MVLEPSKTSAWMRPARASLVILRATSLLVAREYWTLIPGYFFSKARERGRVIWLTIRVGGVGGGGGGGEAEQGGEGAERRDGSFHGQPPGFVGVIKPETREQGNREGMVTA